jgi:hypothetical protein
MKHQLPPAFKKANALKKANPTWSMKKVWAQVKKGKE